MCGFFVLPSKRFSFIKITYICANTFIMMLDDLYKGAQAELNKDQLGYLKPLYFNTFARQSVRKVFNKIFLDIKSNVRKKNWQLDGKNFANYSQYLIQLIEYYSYTTILSSPFVLPLDLEFVQDVFNGSTRISKIEYSTFLDLQDNNYAKPTLCAPYCSKVGDKLVVSPIEINKVNLHYIRTPKVPKWTFQEVDGKPMFDETALDFQDIDMPDTFYDDILTIIVEKASVMLREQLPIQVESQDQNQEIQSENKQ